MLQVGVSTAYIVFSSGEEADAVRPLHRLHRLDDAAIVRLAVEDRAEIGCRAHGACLDR